MKFPPLTISTARRGCGLVLIGEARNGCSSKKIVLSVLKP